MINKYAILFMTTLFFGVNVISFLDIDINIYNSLLLAISIIFLVINRKCFDSKYYVLLLFTIIYGLIKLYTDVGAGTRSLFINVLGPILLYGAYPKINTNNKDNKRLYSILFRLIIVFFIIETSLAIYERIVGKSVFGWADYTFSIMDTGMIEYRSTALLGHPLNNALVVSTIMAFILISPLKNGYKYAIWFWGLLSILCFNARGASIVDIAIFVVYIIHNLFFNKKLSISSKSTILFFTLIGAIIVCYLLNNSIIGGRLINGYIIDSSSQVRIDVWSIFDIYNLSMFLTGVSFSNVDFILYSVGLTATENFWLDWLFRFGLLFLIPYIILFARLIKSQYKGYKIMDVFVTLLGFISTASVNNSLSASFIPLFAFLICIRLFNPHYIKEIMPQKLIKKDERTYKYHRTCI